MITQIVSFGYKHHHPQTFPRETRLLLDVRDQLSNPYPVPGLRTLSGLDARVQAWIEADPRFPAYYAGVLNTLRLEQEKPAPAVVYVGCTGGRHRSVYVAEKLGKELGVPVEHWDLHKHTTRRPPPIEAEEEATP